MAKITRSEVIDTALVLLEEGGLTAISTRRLAQRLGVESASLYWHVKDKSTLLGEMASAIIARRHTLAPPADTESWAQWFFDNACSFRTALLAYPDGALLHAGSLPASEGLQQLSAKIDYLIRAGFTAQQAQRALLTAGQFTLGSVMEEQTRNARIISATPPSPFAESSLQSELRETVESDAQQAFFFGIHLIIDGLKTTLKST